MTRPPEQPPHLVPGYVPPGVPSPPAWGEPPTVQRTDPEAGPAPVPGGTITVYASVGNSDDKLTQAQWSQLIREFVSTSSRFASAVHGTWHSSPEAPFQNVCLCFEVYPTDAAELRRLYVALAHNYRQDSIAWAVVSHTDFVGPVPVGPATAATWAGGS